MRTSLGADREVSEVIVGRRGFITGADQNFAPPASKPMTSDRWAAILREQRLLNPLLYVRSLLARPRLAARGGHAPAERPRGTPARGPRRRRRRAAVAQRAHGPHQPADHGRPQLLPRRRRDRRELPRLAPRPPAACGIRARPRSPRTASSSIARRAPPMRQRLARTRRAFRFPSGVDATFDRALADRGARTTEWLMSFAHLGFIKDGAADVITPRAVAPGSTLIQGNGNQSMIVEQQDGIVVVEAALSDYRAEALLGYITETFPGKPIRYVTVGHHHSDHAGGMRRSWPSARGRSCTRTRCATSRTCSPNRSSRLLRDRLDRSDAEADILAVPATGTVTLADPVRPVILLAEPTTHATTTVLSSSRRRACCS